MAPMLRRMLTKLQQGNDATTLADLPPSGGDISEEWKSQDMTSATLPRRVSLLHKSYKATVIATALMVFAVETCVADSVSQTQDETFKPCAALQAFDPNYDAALSRAKKSGKPLGIILNGHFISTNPAVNGKPVSRMLLAGEGVKKDMLDVERGDCPRWD